MGVKGWIISLLSGLIVIMGLSVQAGVPEKVVYQGRLSRSGAAVASSQNIKVTLMDPNGVESPQIVFSSLVTLAATGEFSVLLNMPPNYDWERAAPELEIEVGGEVLTPREKINVSPYAFLAKKVAAGGVSAAAIQSGAVTDVHVSTISAAKIMLPGTASAMTVWQSTVVGQQDKIDSAKIFGIIPTVPTSHAANHGQGGADAVTLSPHQVTGRAIVSNTSGTQVVEAVSVATDTLTIKGMRGAQETSYYPLRVFGTQNPQVEQFNVRGDGQTYFKGSVGIGTSFPSERLEVTGGNLKVSGGISASTLTLTGNASAVNVNATGNLGVAGIATSGSLNVSGSASVGSLTTSGNVGIGTNSPSAKLDVRGSINFTSQKFCRVTVPNMFAFTTLVPSGWTSGTCANFMASSGGLQFQLGCIFENSFSIGGINGGIPSPNCSW
ncbi:MAG: hypothetical protein IPP35_04085 [Elusimicrobia bacterium]|nr:hypothetical protein [Elusimicrobiota bacterium]